MSTSEVTLAVSLALPPAVLASEAPSLVHPCSHSGALCFEIVPQIHPPIPSPRPAQILIQSLESFRGVSKHFENLAKFWWDWPGRL